MGLSLENYAAIGDGFAGFDAWWLAFQVPFLHPTGATQKYTLAKIEPCFIIDLSRRARDAWSQAKDRTQNADGGNTVHGLLMASLPLEATRGRHVDRRTNEHCRTLSEIDQLAVELKALHQNHPNWAVLYEKVRYSTESGFKHCVSGVERDDFRQTSWIALILAVRTYDAGRTSFINHFRWRLRAEKKEINENTHMFGRRGTTDRISNIASCLDDLTSKSDAASNNEGRDRQPQVQVSEMYRSRPQAEDAILQNAEIAMNRQELVKFLTDYELWEHSGAVSRRRNRLVFEGYHNHEMPLTEVADYAGLSGKQAITACNDVKEAMVGWARVNSTRLEQFSLSVLGGRARQDGGDCGQGCFGIPPRKGRLIDMIPTKSRLKGELMKLAVSLSFQ